ncbi:MAG: C10 family peptidase [Prevotella sp.]|nr:C10 family peptidase [Prevotella sp.]
MKINKPLLKEVLILTVFASLALTVTARPRSTEEMKAAAQKALAPDFLHRGVKDNREIRMMEMRQGVTVMGYDGGGFVIVANDDVFPEVMGVSQTAFNSETANPAFLWWLEVMDRITAEPTNAPLANIVPDSLGFPAQVSPMLKTTWGQGAPYNNLCPEGCPTGCVATAATQVLKYFKWPERGVGTVWTYYPFADFDGLKCEENIEEVEYDYDLMIDKYESKGVMGATAKQKKAVAELMYHTGLAMKAVYMKGGTGAYSETLSYGLRNNLGYPFAVTIDRENYTDEEWMTIIFDNISRGVPLVYGGSDWTYSGHEFVLHGYNSSGLVYINWGWNGSEDGYFNLAALRILMGYYDFRYYQDMVVRCEPAWTSADTIDVMVETPGTLRERLGEERLFNTACLKVRGGINGSDLGTLRAMAGCCIDGHTIQGNLSVLDLSEADIVEGGEPYMKEGDTLYVTRAGVMPRKAFAGCFFLIDVALPKHLREYEGEVFAGCNNLDRVSIQAGEESDFTLVGSFVMSKDGKTLIECLPGRGDDICYDIPQGVETVAPHAFAGRFLYERLDLPASIDTIGPGAFNRCFDLFHTYVHAQQPPAIDETAIDLLDISLRTLHVPAGCGESYRHARGWEQYGKYIVEFDDEQAAGLHEFASRKAQPASLQTYDLQGRKMVVNRPGTRSIVVRNGRKVMGKQ